ncbi:putative ATP-dependent DNA helicase HelY [Mycobacteroides stephanolepidis]|uniref:Probable helicase HelY n=1 Tax=[Mycobacterium] stephanolepidis TaxID=1520670 RepID=A0A1Z4EWW9_9MYCO|nr:RNA helicase [[Mycobacterium] stephanolepidis]BAX97442.1 putative ATP-dependent DNA helicase HelY [[Mycobacterium] stephanolepidis]
MTSIGTQLSAFSQGLSFALDPFQVRACTALENGHGVLVCAPTGAGKTIVGEFAVHLALAAGRKCFYTTPIKALSNQKYNDLVSVYGPEKVGLLTGDSSINSDAPVVVMTTEVLRNMLYADSPALHGLSYVVMDEVHFLADRFRGAVWEEVILHLPEEVALASLSATVSNAEEFGGWIKTVRGDTAVVVDETRPVPLWQHVMVGRRLFDLFDYDGKKTDVDPELTRYIAQRRQADRFADFDRPRRRGPQDRGGRPPTLYRPPSRPEVITRLDEDGLLPAITFIFSRAGCDGAVAQCLRSRLRLTTEEDRREIVAIIDRRTEGLPEADLDVLGYWQWREGLLRGIAAHHAGMLPVFRHTVEELFTKGLVKAVFATETLALGINMPARTVVLERLVKFNGEQHAALTPGEYTQLTGRAGRRGIDVEGHAVVLWTPEVEPGEIAGLASTRTFPLRSSFAPSYNMTINLVHRMGPDPARELLERSFAQFQADRSVVGLVRGIERGKKMLDEIAKEIDGHDGAALEYVRLRGRLSERERAAARSSRLARRGAANDALAALKRGDVIAIPHGRRNGVAVVLEPAHDDDDPRPLVLTEHRWAGRISSADYSGTAEPLGSISLPKRVEHRQPKVRRDVASALRSALDEGRVRRPQPVKGRKNDPGADGSDLGVEVERLRREIREHPVHHAPNREELARTAERYLRIERDNAQLQKKVSAATNSLARTFDRILTLLTERGYVQDSSELGKKVTKDGLLLARIYSESDLLVAECLRRGLWAGLKPAELAAVASAVLYESRGDAVSVTGEAPTAALRAALAETHRALARLRHDEQRHQLAPTREVDEGFVAAVHRWATTGDLAASLEAAGDTGTALPAGDFVRWCRQVVDLLDQINKAAPDAELRSVARAAVADVRRGVVAVDGT